MNELAVGLLFFAGGGFMFFFAPIYVRRKIAIQKQLYGDGIPIPGYTAAQIALSRCLAALLCFAGAWILFGHAHVTRSTLKLPL